MLSAGLCMSNNLFTPKAHKLVTFITDNPNQILEWLAHILLVMFIMQSRYLP